MKKLLITLLSFALIASFAVAQDGKKMMKEAEKNLKNFISNPAETAALQAAMSSFEGAFKDEEIASEPKNWLKKGKLFNDLADNQIKLRLLNPAMSISAPEAAVTAFHSFHKAMEVSSKKGDIKKAVKAIAETEGNLSNTAIELYRDKNYDMAFVNFQASMEAQEILKSNESVSRLDDPTIYGDQLLYTALSAYFGSYKKESIPYLEGLLELPDVEGEESNKPFVYEALYKSYKGAENMDTAMKYLNDGRAAYPDDTGLLFTEINYYLEQDRLDILVEKLELALEKEPGNLSVVNTLGNVYDRFSSKTWEEGNKEAALGYFDKALKYYNISLEQQPEDFTATYSMGALYYNRAALLTQELNTLANDFSPEGTKKYNVLKEESDGYFEKALPFFLKAEEMNANDLNTLIALREIYARKSMFDKVEEYKGKFEVAKALPENN